LREKKGDKIIFTKQGLFQKTRNSYIGYLMFTFVVRVTLSENELVDELESGYVYGVETFLEDYELVEEVCCSKGKGIVKSYYPKYIKFVFIYNEENI